MRWCPRAAWLAAVFAVLAATARADAPATGLDGTWQGTLVTPRAPLRLRFRISQRPDSACLGTFASLDEGGVELPLDRLDATADSVWIDVGTLGATFRAARDADRERLHGQWKQRGAPLPLELTRTAAVPESAATQRPAAPPDSAWGFPLLLDVPMPPTPFTAAGRIHLVYELRLTNFNVTAEAFVTRIEVLDAGGTLRRYTGAELNSLLGNPFAKDGIDNRVLSPGRAAIAYLWLDLAPGTPPPARLWHRVTLRDGGTITGAEITCRDRSIAAIGPPLRGAGWIARGGPGNPAPHRRALILGDGQVHLAQRFAIDWTRVSDTGGLFTGDPRDNRSYAAYGAEAIAVSRGVVVAVLDSLAENSPGSPPAVPITPRTACGNYVVLDLGGGRFATYAHLQPGSLRVRAGEHVRRGQVLGLVGNSGNSQWPHLHFHVADGPSPLFAEGIPYAFDRFEARTPTGTWVERRNELPAMDSRVRFR